MEWVLLFIDPDVIIQFMDSLLDMVFGMAKNTQLEE